MPTIDIPADNVTATRPGYLAVPDAPGPWPGVVLVQDVRGMRSDLCELADTFAAAGYLALAPDLYSGRSTVQCLGRIIKSHYSGTGEVFDDIAAAREYLFADPRCTGKIGIAGFCLGAGLALVAAPKGQFDAAASNYGLIPKDLSVLDKACPIVASFGAKDPIVKAGSAALLEAALTEACVPHDVKEYPDVGHSYMNSSSVPPSIRRVLRMAYSGPEAEDSWRRLFSFFGEHLAGENRENPVS